MTSAADIISAIESNPDDRDACAVYADWLLEQHDPLGEIMALALQKDVSGDLDFKTLIWKYCRKHFSFVEPTHHEQWTWSNGLIRGMNVVTPRTGAAVKALATTPGARFVRELAVDVSDDPIPMFVDAPLPRTLRKLALSLKMRVELALLYPQLSELEELSLSPPPGGFGILELPSLRTLTTVLWTKDTFFDLCYALLPRLEHLQLEWAKWSLLDELDLLFAPKLERLTLGWFDEDSRAEAYAVMARSPLVKRVRSLSLPKVERDDVALLVANAPELAHLIEIRLPWKSFKKPAQREELIRTFGVHLVFE